jgi:hypothetical protein
MKGVTSFQNRGASLRLQGHCGVAGLDITELPLMQQYATVKPFLAKSYKKVLHLKWRTVRKCRN